MVLVGNPQETVACRDLLFSDTSHPTEVVIMELIHNIALKSLGPKLSRRTWLARGVECVLPFGYPIFGQL